MNWLNREVPLSSLVFYRIYFGLLMAWGLARFWWNGWLERSFIQPEFFFKYWGFEWVVVPDPFYVYALFAVGILAALLVSAGLFYRTSSLILFLSFTYIELMDQANFLNHYYLLSILSFLNLFLPLNRRFSLDVWRGAVSRVETIPAWCLYLLRGQIATVYFFAGLAKLGSDWLLHAQPINLWMMAQSELPLIGPWLALGPVQLLMAWAGFLFDTTIWIFMLFPRTRVPAYVIILGFHFLTGLLFPIGLFPYIMVGMATLFFDPQWPDRALAKVSLWKAPPLLPNRAPSNSSSHPRFVLAGLALWFLVQWTTPLRHFLYTSDLLWSEEGMRFSWKVMVREKNGHVNFRVVDRNSARSWDVSASQYLVQHQEMEMSGQPDMILQLAHHIRDDFARRGNFDVAVYAEAWVSLNGRPSALMIDPEFDLTSATDGLSQKSWIRPAPREFPRPLSVSKIEVSR